MTDEQQIADGTIIMPQFKSHDILLQVRVAVSQAIQHHISGETVQYAVSAALVPTAEGISSALMIYLAIPSSVVGQQIQTPIVIPQMILEDEAIEQVVTDALDQMIAVRSQTLAESSGLIVPGT